MMTVLKCMQHLHKTHQRRSNKDSKFRKILSNASKLSGKEKNALRKIQRFVNSCFIIMTKINDKSCQHMQLCISD